jgi:hypothetical protein
VDQPPTVAFARPLTGATATIGTALDIELDAQDDVAVSKVELFADGVSRGALSVEPYRFSVNMVAPARAMSLQAVATDSGGHIASAMTTIQVVADDRPPMVGFRAPLEGAPTFAGRLLAVEVVASDNVAVQTAQLFVDGASAGTQASGAAEGLYRVFHWQVPVPVSRAGTELILRAEASDPSGLHAQRTIAARVVQDVPPVVAVLAPAAGSPY